MVSVVDIQPKSQYNRALLTRLPPPGQSPWQFTHSHPIPPLEAGQIKIKTTHVALNPFDWQVVAFEFGVGPEAKVMGRDGAGIVVEVGSGVKRFKVGDRVWFCANSSGSGTGAFQEHSVHSSCEIGHTPPNLTDGEAATLGTGLITAGVAFFRTLGLNPAQLSAPRSSKSGQWMLIWGGSGITGVYLIQMAHYLGYRVICAASPGNFEYVKSLGADVVLNRWNSPSELVDSIRQATGDKVRIAIDNVGKQTAELCLQVLQGSKSWRSEHGVPTVPSDTPGRLVPLAGSPAPATADPNAVRSVDVLRISFSTTFYGHRDFSVALLDAYTALLTEGEIVPAKIKYVDGGLCGIVKGLDDLRHGRIPGGYKLVARLADTPLLSEHPLTPEVYIASPTPNVALGAAMGVKAVSTI